MEEKWTTVGGSTISKILGGRSNVFLLTRGDRRLLVDTSSGENRRALDAALRSAVGAHRTGESSAVDLLVLTHAHFDHAANTSHIRDAYGARVIASSAESLGLNGGNTPMPRGTNLFSLGLSGFVNLFSDRIRYEPCAADIVVEGKSDLAEFGFSAYLLPTPGHTAGSLSVIVDDEIAIVGDAIFGIFPGSAFPPFADDSVRLVESWASLLGTGCRIFLPSHGHAVSREVLARDYERRRRQ